MMKCPRCKEESFGYIMSMFNEELICSKCKEKETHHPEYIAAEDAERAETLAGNFNFKGVGKPKDL